MEAMEIVSRMSEKEEIRAAAVLHDTLEDTDTTKDELVQIFGQRVADLVASESEDKLYDQFFPPFIRDNHVPVPSWLRFSFPGGRNGD